MKIFRNTLTLIFAVLIFSASFTVTYAKSKTYTTEELEKVAGDIVDWEKSQFDFNSKENLFSGKFLPLAGSTEGDWLCIALNRLEVKDDYKTYLNSLKDYVEEKYRTESGLSRYKATEWHRIILAVVACGGNPEHFGKDKNGKDINLLSDGIYNREQKLNLQGINGVVWGLIALDSDSFKVPTASKITREKIIADILKNQNADGGWSIGGGKSDIDMTAMALQAIGKYKERKNVSKAIEKSLSFISVNQKNSGGFKSKGVENAESICQVIIALNTLKIDTNSDERFIKNGRTLISALMDYKCSKGGFSHIKNGEPDLIVNQQVLLALASQIRGEKGRTALFDFSDNKVKFLGSDRDGNISTIFIISLIIGIGLVTAISIIVRKKKNKTKDLHN